MDKDREAEINPFIVIKVRKMHRLGESSVNQTLDLTVSRV
jgi:hypothetical protein